jgi:hypothetical protein
MIDGLRVPTAWRRPALGIAAILCAGCEGTIFDRGVATTDPPKERTDAVCQPNQPSAPVACSGSEVVAKKRLIRLSFNQLTNSLSSLLGAPLGTQIATNPAYALVDAAHRTFPSPLSNPREGAVITDNQWDTGDQMAREAAKYVLDNFAAVTGCATATDACAQPFVRAFAAKAYRRPLTPEETADIDKVYADVKGFGFPVQEATQYGVYAVLNSPLFLYRTELGGNALAMGPLSPYELASALSYFLADSPPDPSLLDAAAKNMLASADQIRPHVTRILASDAARANLNGAMMGYFAIPTIETVVIDTGAFPNYGPGVANSMYHEAELFLNSTLWNGKVLDLLTSRRTFVNTTLAPFYGLAPPSGTQSEADFVPVELPATRAGILTMPGFLVARARPKAGSVVGRGLLVNEAFLCVPNPVFPDALGPTIEAASAMLQGKPEKEKAAYRATTKPCNTCHTSFDPYGLTLENFDTIGQYRTVDEMNRAIDASAALPPVAGGACVKNAPELADAVAKSGAFVNCLAKNVLAYALAEVSDGVATESCAIKAVVDRFNASDGTFTSLVRELAVSQALSVRAPGGAP